MTRIARSPNPLDGMTQLLVDGTNLLYALSRGPERQPPAAVIGRLRAAIPATAKITLVFDGPPERGVRGERIASGLTVHYAGRHSADTILITLVEGEGPEAADSLLVVTDDRELRRELGRRGARTAGTAWLIGRLDRPRLASPAIGNARPPAPPRITQPPPGQELDEQPRWNPGRGATTKRGNGRRSPRPSRG